MPAYFNKNAWYFVFLILMVCLGLWMQLNDAGLGIYGPDDPYIFDHSVEGILAGKETRFINSSPWHGVTSPAFVAALLAFNRVLSLDVAHWVVGTLSTLLLASGLYVLCRRTTLHPGLSVVVVLTGLLNRFTIIQITNGLETGMAMAAMAWGLVVLDHKKPPLWGYAMMGVIYFIRPELAILTAIFGVYMLIKRPDGYLQGLLVTGLVFAVCAGVLWYASGMLVPKTLSAKTYFFALGCDTNFSKFLSISHQFLLFLFFFGIFSIGFVFVSESQLKYFIFIFAFIFLCSYFIRLPFLYSNHFRYLGIFVPFAVLGWATWLAKQKPILGVDSRAIGGFVVVLTLVFAGSSLHYFSLEHHKYSDDNLATARWVATNVPKDAIVMVHDAGAISRVGEQRLVDIVGLKSPASVDIHRRTTFASCGGDTTAIVDIAQSTGASYLVTLLEWDDGKAFTKTLADKGWAVERVDHMRGETLFRVYKITPPTKN